ncbi:MAG: carbon-nitrogen hydrolase family protein [Clostridiales bacterium]|jgi:hypothetical protein|nr:carbon-nitrogen hydrolase family protein [Clostridiales bacterium]
MNIVTVTDKRIMDEIGDYEGMFGEGDILIAGFGTTDDFNYIAEFDGRTEYFKKYIRLSKEKKIILICATVSRLMGRYYHTAAVIHKGTVLGVSDQTHKTHSELTLGNSLKLYETDGGVLGILIGEDIFFPECPMTLALCGAERLIYLSNGQYNKETDAMLKAAAIFCGISVTAVFLDFTVEYTNRGMKNVIESEDLLIFENVLKRNDIYLKCRRQIVYDSILVNKRNGGQ